MKAIGITRKVDQLGRIVIPKEIRRTLDIKTEDESSNGEADFVEIYTEGNSVILKKYIPGCHCCTNTDNLIEVLGLKLCPSCLDRFNEYRKMVDKARGEK
jgi:AbrB family transcriptional regulator, transcriptional pleiotropic regulator of transition state genes